MSIRLSAFICIIVLYFWGAKCNIDSLDEERYFAGKTDLAYLKQEASLPKYGKCWLDALEELEIGCSRLTEDELYRMTFFFMNCFLLKTGRDKQDCPPNKNIEDCTKFLKSEAYAVFTKFFTHTQNVCFFLQAQKWQATTRLTMNRLVDTSAAVSSKMESSNMLQSEILKRQGDSIHLQEVLLESGNLLKKTLDESKLDLDKVMADIKVSSSEQKDLLFNVFYKIKSFQSMVVGEMSGFISLAFYLLALLISYLVTSANRSSSARLPIFIILSVNMAVERILFDFIRFDGSGDLHSKAFPLTEEEYYSYRDFSRMIAGTASLLTLLWHAYWYQDVGVLNNELLREMQQRNSVYENEVLGKLNDLVKKHEARYEEYDDSDSIGYGSDFYSDSSSCTLDQTEDRTIQLDSTTISTNSSLDLREDLRFLCNSTPFKELVSEGLVSRLDTSLVREERATLESLDKTLTPSRTYNLRPRKTPTSDLGDARETPAEFGKEIKSLERESKSNSRKLLSSASGKPRWFKRL